MDTSSGFTPSAPIKSFERLNEILDAIDSQPITVKIDGDYYLEKTAVIKKSCVTFEPQGDTARIIGGHRLVGWRPDVFNGCDCYSLFIPEVKSGEWDFSDLYVGGRRATLCRYPKNSTLRAVSTELPTVTDLHTHNSWFIADKNDVLDIEGIEDSIVSFYHFWIDEHTPVAAYDKESGKITFKYRSRFALTTLYEKNEPSDMYYYFENIPCAFSSVGEWFLDKKNGMLYYIPNPDEDMENIEVFAPTLKTLVSVEGEADKKIFGVRLRGFEFICSRGDYESRTDLTSTDEVGFASDVQSAHGLGGAITFTHAYSSSVEDCRLSMLGLYAIEIADGCSGIRIERNTISDIGGGGVKISGSNDELDYTAKTGGNMVCRNLISHCGKRYAAACGVFIKFSAQNIIEENEICYLDYTGISAGWIWGYIKSETYGEIIRNNHIHHIGMGRLSDMGGIYLLGEQRGTVVSGNIIHDVIGANYGGWGIYTDEGSSYITVENNTVYRCKSHCYHQNYGKNNSVRNNLFAFGGIAVVHMSRTHGHAGIFLEENALISGGEPIYTFSETHDALPFTDLRSANNSVYDTTRKSPVLYRLDGKEYSLKEWQGAFGKDEGSRVKKPSFVKICKDRVEIKK